MTSTTQNITVETQKQIVADFITKNLPKAQLAKQYNVSPRTVGRYIEKFEVEVKTQIEAQKAQAVTTAQKLPRISNGRKPVVRDADGYTQGQRWLIDAYNRQKATMQKVENRVGVTGRAKKGVKTIRFITMETLETLSNQGVLKTMKKEDVIRKIADAANVDLKVAKQYYSGHKIFFMK